MGIADGNRVMALARIVGSIGGDRADVLIVGDLVSNSGSMGASIARQRICKANVTGGADIAGRDLDGAHLKRFFVDTYVYLAPYPALGAAMLARIPRAFALRLDTCAVDEQVQWPGVPPRYGRLTFSVV